MADLAYVDFVLIPDHYGLRSNLRGAPTIKPPVIARRIPRRYVGPEVAVNAEEVIKTEQAAEAAEVAEPKPVLSPQPSAWVVYFGHGSTRLGPASIRELESVLAVFEKSAADLELTGHTDAVGPAQFNRALSRARTRAVKRWLVGRGLPEARIRVRALGEQQPQQSGTDRAANRLNRRVEIRLEPR